jgi:hypothetical protein
MDFNRLDPVTSIGDLMMTDVFLEILSQCRAFYETSAIEVHHSFFAVKLN